MLTSSFKTQIFDSTSWEINLKHKDLRPSTYSTEILKLKKRKEKKNNKRIIDSELQRNREFPCLVLANYTQQVFPQLGKTDHKN